MWCGVVRAVPGRRRCQPARRSSAPSASSASSTTEPGWQRSTAVGTVPLGCVRNPERPLARHVGPSGLCSAASGCCAAPPGARCSARWSIGRLLRRTGRWIGQTRQRKRPDSSRRPMRQGAGFEHRTRCTTLGGPPPSHQAPPQPQAPRWLRSPGRTRHRDRRRCPAPPQQLGPGRCREWCHPGRLPLTWWPPAPTVGPRRSWQPRPPPGRRRSRPPSQRRQLSVECAQVRRHRRPVRRLRPRRPQRSLPPPPLTAHSARRPRWYSAPRRGVGRPAPHRAGRRRPRANLRPSAPSLLDRCSAVVPHRWYRPSRSARHTSSRPSRRASRCSARCWVVRTQDSDRPINSAVRAASRSATTRKIRTSA